MCYMYQQILTGHTVSQLLQHLQRSSISFFVTPLQSREILLKSPAVKTNSRVFLEKCYNGIKPNNFVE